MFVFAILVVPWIFVIQREMIWKTFVHLGGQGARVVDASHFESEYILGRKLSFYCMAQGIPRPHITWLKDGIELYAHPFFQVCFSSTFHLSFFPVDFSYFNHNHNRSTKMIWYTYVVNGRI